MLKDVDALCLLSELKDALCLHVVSYVAAQHRDDEARSVLEQNGTDPRSEAVPPTPAPRRAQGAARHRLSHRDDDVM